MKICIFENENMHFFIGANETGKSNFLSAIKKIYEGKIIKNDANFNKNKDDFSKIDFSWKLNEKIVNKWKKIGYKINENNKDIFVSCSIKLESDEEESKKEFSLSDINLNKFIYKKLKNNYKIIDFNKKHFFTMNEINDLEILEGKEELEIKETIVNLIIESLELKNSIMIFSFDDFDQIQKNYSF